MTVQQPHAVSCPEMMWRYIFENYAIHVKGFLFVDCKTLRIREVSIQLPVSREITVEAFQEF
jgi:hypothetical protein